MNALDKDTNLSAAQPDVKLVLMQRRTMCQHSWFALERLPSIVNRSPPSAA
jgi:hypothetical protein